MLVIEETCRICLSNNNLSNIFKEGAQIADKIMFCAAVQIRKNDKFPQLICNQCLFYLDIGYVFRTVCEATDVKLRNCVETTENIAINIETVNDLYVTNEVVIDSFGCIEFSDKQNCSSTSESGMDDGPESNKSVRNIKISKVGRHIAKKNSGKCPQRFPPVGISEIDPENSVISHNDTLNEETFDCDVTRTVSSEIDVEKKSSEKMFPCKACNKSFPYKSHLMRHLTVHTRVKKFTCYHCNQKFINRYNLRVHLRKHTGNFPLNCKFCGRGFSSPSLLERHVNSHIGNLKYQCKFCSKKVLHSSSLKLHEKMHVSKPTYSCDICSKSFTYTNSLNEHKKTHLGLKQHSCQICLKSFTRKTSLTRHMGGHNSINEFKCDDCNFICSNNINYVNHMKDHLKFSCDI